MEKMQIVLVLFLISNLISSQTLLLEENFDYVASTNLTNNGWTKYSGTTGPINVSSGSLSYTNYPSSNIGNSANVIGSASTEDDKITFTEQSSGSVYISFLVNFSTATISANGDYFFGIFTSTGETAKGRVYVKRIGTDVAFGVSKAGTTPNLSPFSYLLNTTYLLVLKYTFNLSSSDDVISLFINPNLNGSEPTPDLTNIDVSTDLANVGAIFLRQGVSAYNLIIDGIRISDNWNLAPLPVKLTSFIAKTKNGGVILNWATSTEVNNYGFSVEKLTSLFPNWKEIAFIEGHGNSNSPKMYSFFDNSLFGNASYRLKQIDVDGSFEYSDVLSISTNLVKTELFQNNPNPFNPSTNINYSLSDDTQINISVYNILGQKVAELVNQKVSAGVHNVEFNAKNLTSGFYFYRIETPSYTKTMKMLLIK